MLKSTNYWYISRSTEHGRYYPAAISQNKNISVILWTRLFENAFHFPSEFAAMNFVKQREWKDSDVAVIHINNGAMKDMIRIV